MNRFLTKILVPFLLFLSTLSLTGQEYTPMDLSEGATWSHVECGFKPDWTAVYKFKIIGDTVIALQTYKKIYYQAKRGPVGCTTCGFTFNRDSATLFALVRQIIPKKQVYFINPAISDKEWLGYNFDITNVGQIVTGFSLIFTVNPESTPPGIYVYQMEVGGIDSLCVNGEYVRRYFFDAGAGGNIYHLPEYWVEGIGSTHGLLVQGYGGPDWYHSLYCFHNKEGGVYYDYEAIPECIDNTSLFCELGYDCTPVILNDQIYPDAMVNMYPNPAGENIIIESRLTSDQYKIAIFNMTGKKVFDKVVPCSQELETIHLSHLSPGFYYLTIESEGFFTGKKIVKE